MQPTPLQHQNIRFVPSIHQRMIFADEVRRIAGEWRPDCIAVELPPGLKQWIIRGVMQLPQISVVCHPVADREGSLFYVPIDPADSLIEAVRWAISNEVQIEFLDGAADAGARTIEAIPAESRLPDDWMIGQIGLEKYVELAIPYLAMSESAPDPTIAFASSREDWMARALAAAAKKHERVLCVLGMAHYAGVRRRLEQLAQSETAELQPAAESFKGAFLSHVHPATIPQLMREVPYLVHLREVARDGEELRVEATTGAPFDKLDALVTTYRESEQSYKEKYKGTISPARFKTLLQFTRNLAFVEGRLQPDSYHAVMGAKSTVDGDYGHELYQRLKSYPAQRDDSEQTTFRMKDKRGIFSDRDDKFAMFPWCGEPQMETVTFHFRRRPTPQQLAKWASEWDERNMRGICSWPPEDERQEKFMLHLRKRALQVVTEDKKQVTEFTTSMMDGLDIRETMRNFHTRKLYVQQTPQPHGQVGAVALIFDELNDPMYGWRTTLYAENQNESDIAFYATPLGSNVVGPRISRTEFGGILSVYPAWGVPDIWQLEGIADLKTCAEVLLAGAIILSHHKFVAYVARKPPSSLMREIAAQYKKRIIYIPIQGFSEAQLKKIRNFHILGGHDVRSYAADYIFDD